MRTVILLLCLLLVTPLLMSKGEPSVTVRSEGLVVYNHTIKFELGEIFTYPLPHQSNLYYRMHAIDGAMFSVQAISQDLNKQPYSYNLLSTNTTSIATLRRSYELDKSLSNLNLMVAFEDTVNNTQKLAIYIEYDEGHGSTDPPPRDPQTTIALAGLSVIVTTGIIVGAILFAIKRHRMNQLTTLDGPLESDPLLSVVGSK